MGKALVRRNQLENENTLIKDKIDKLRRKEKKTGDVPKKLRTGKDLTGATIYLWSDDAADAAEEQNRNEKRRTARTPRTPWLQGAVAVPGTSPPWGPAAGAAEQTPRGAAEGRRGGGE